MNKELTIEQAFSNMIVIAKRAKDLSLDEAQHIFASISKLDAFIKENTSKKQEESKK